MLQSGSAPPATNDRKYRAHTVDNRLAQIKENRRVMTQANSWITAAGIGLLESRHDAADRYQ
jgi:hypothetical protein